MLEERDLLGRVSLEERLPRERIEFLCEEIAFVELKEGRDQEVEFPRIKRPRTIECTQEEIQTQRGALINTRDELKGP